MTLKVLWISNAPYVASGYGQQTDIFTRLLKASGHEPTIFGYYGQKGANLRLGGIDILPGSNDQWGNDMLMSHWKQIKPDVAVLLCDLWVYDSHILKSIPITPWAPVDHDPIPPPVAEKASYCKHTWAMSRFGENAMRRVGLDPWYVPHGIDTMTFRPIDRAKAREIWKLPPDRFIAVMVAANRGYPSRKAFDRVLKAWGKFIQTHPDAILYCHTDPIGHQNGLNLAQVADFYDIDPANLRFPEMYPYMRGDFTSERINDLYNAADVLLLPSMGGGFEIPLIEAQSAGCPVVTTAFTAMKELVGPGYAIEVDPFDDMMYTLQGSEQCAPRPSAILKGIEWAYEQKGNEILRAQAREFGSDYDARFVFSRYMMPAIEAMAEINADLTPGIKHAI